MLEFIVQAVAEAVFQLAGYATGWVLVPLFSLGRAVVGTRKRDARIFRSWPRVSRAEDGKFIVDADLGTLIGLVFWFAVAGAWFLAHHVSR